MKKSWLLSVCILLSLFCISGCEGPKPPLTDQWEAYSGIFEENNVTAELAVRDDTEYLQLTFPDGAVATYQYGLEQITLDLTKMKNGTTASAELEMNMKGEKTAVVHIYYESGSTYVEFVLPDFTEIMPDKVFVKQTNAEAFAIIEKWISEEEMAALYQQAKDMEQRMREYQTADIDPK